MPGSRQSGPLDGQRDGTNINDGTLCGQVSPIPRPTGSALSPRPKCKIRVLALDGAKVHDFLFHVALSEIQWQDLDRNPRKDIDHTEQKHKALDRASMLYDRFLEACSEGGNAATAFLAAQHNLQKKYLQKSQIILHSLQREAAHDQVVLSEVAFGGQIVKSTATAGVAIVGLFLTGPAILTGAGIALGFDLTIEMINRVGSSGESKADAVVVGFKQTVANDAASVIGSGKQVSLDKTKEVLQKTLSYPLKSSKYRSAAATAARLDVLLKALGWLSAGVTLFTEFNPVSGPVRSSYEEMQRTKRSYSELQ